jgi:hypothetical protein
MYVCMYVCANLLIHRRVLGPNELSPNPACMYVCVCMFISANLFIHRRLLGPNQLSTNPAYMYVCICVYACTYAHIYTCVCVCTVCIVTQFHRMHIVYHHRKQYIIMCKTRTRRILQSMTTIKSNSRARGKRVTTSRAYKKCVCASFSLCMCITSLPAARGVHSQAFLAERAKSCRSRRAWHVPASTHHGEMQTRYAMKKMRFENSPVPTTPCI